MLLNLLSTTVNLDYHTDSIYSHILSRLILFAAVFYNCITCYFSWIDRDHKLSFLSWKVLDYMTFTIIEGKTYTVDERSFRSESSHVHICNRKAVTFIFAVSILTSNGANDFDRFTLMKQH